MTITTRELLDAEVARTGLPIDQLVRIVAKSALIRHLASTQDGRDFVLKGGTLLHHCYDGPRFSVIDADFTHRKPAQVTPPDLSEALTLKEADLVIDFGSVTWEQDGGIYQASTTYTMGQFTDRRGMKVTVSVRTGEWMAPQSPLIYRDPLLAGVQAFPVNGLTLEELAAEKLLAWCSKQLVKHAVDLAYIARDHASLDLEKAVTLAQRKFEIEGGMRRFKSLGIRDFSDLRRALLSAAAVRALKRELGAGLLLPRDETRRPADQTLQSASNVERLLREFWLPRL